MSFWRQVDYRNLEGISACHISVGVWVFRWELSFLDVWPLYSPEHLRVAGQRSGTSPCRSLQQDFGVSQVRFVGSRFPTALVTPRHASHSPKLPFYASSSELFSSLLDLYQSEASIPRGCQCLVEQPRNPGKPTSTRYLINFK